MDYLAENYLWIKVLHLFSVFSWMAGMLYLPRLFAYHTTVNPTSESAIMLGTMERRLLKIIMNPAMIASFFFGILMLMAPDMLDLKAGWLHAKILFALVMAGMHGFLAKCYNDFQKNQNRHSNKFYRALNEIPAFLLLLIIILVIIKPF